MRRSSGGSSGSGCSTYFLGCKRWTEQGALLLGGPRNACRHGEAQRLSSMKMGKCCDVSQANPSSTVKPTGEGTCRCCIRGWRATAPVTLYPTAATSA
jgi:hypothetical protein